MSEEKRECDGHFQCEFPKRINQISSQFLYKLFEKKDNVLISPYSLIEALMMTLVGTKGETKNELLETIGLIKIKEEEIFQFYKDYHKRLKNEETIEVTVANSLWMREENEFFQGFKQILEKQFEAKIDYLTTKESINNWVREQTAGKIRDMVDTIDESTLMLLLNAVYFYGEWSKPFDRDLTSTERFTTSEGISVEIPFMLKRDYIMYKKTEKYETVRLFYGDQRSFCMDLLLPREKEKLRDIIKEISNKDVKWEVPNEESYGVIKVPKFSIAVEHQLKDMLIDLGVKKAFDPSEADFSGIASIPPNLYINEVKSKAFIELNEEGTEAAAVTSVEVRGGGEQEVFNLAFNHPFLFRICDCTNETVHFVGYVANPRNQG
ncbi:serpin family protein [Bacillus shivajii]|uniref:serpin family protein n=1 Tax=Bacillus shivajii TaxID=1983719 RepID=UPI001CFA0E55|nr:serpin family protein [Bacillus shivajii]UCZ52524.1 serpin family protein [Bacillus shivajii]